jgi:hypothetical protein
MDYSDPVFGVQVSTMFDIPGPAIVYPFKSNGDDSEIELSILSMMEFFRGHLNIVIVGDKPQANLPPWTVHVQQDFLSEPLDDAIQKLELICKLDIGSEFIYCHDDIFALQEFTLEDLKETVLFTHIRDYETWSPHNKWAAAKKHSQQLLNKRPIHDTATHMPRVFNKQFASKLLKSHTDKKLWDFQIIYDATHTPLKSFQPVGPRDKAIFRRVDVATKSVSNVEAMLSGKRFCNLNSSAFTESVKQYISKEIAKARQVPLPSSTKTAEKLSPPLVRLPIYSKCVHRGPNIGETVPCGTCAALTKDQPIFECNVHGYGVLRKPKKHHPKFDAMNCVSCFSEGWGFQKRTEDQ